MSALIYILAYLAIAVFLIAVIAKFVSYLKNPIHVRWELYPVAHEGGGRAEYGGSYLEDVDWWEKPREVSKLGELKVMIPEILFLKAVWEHNRSLWYVTYPFHLGLYILCAFIGLLFVGSISEIFGVAVGTESSCVCGSALFALTNLLGPVGFILAIAGAAGLFFSRMTNADLRKYSSFGHYFNLLFFILAMGVALATWLFADPTFVMARSFIKGLITFSMPAVSNSLFVAQVVISVLLVAYIPLTHMSHFFMKYFMYHDIRWGDAPNVNSPETAAKIGIVLNYPITWAAEHIRGDGSRNTWAEVATFNPAREPEGEKE